MKFLKKSICELNIKQSLIIYFVYIFVISLLSAIYAHFSILKFGLADINNNIILSSLQFDFGGLIQNIVNDNNFFQIRTENKIKYYLFKSPLLATILSLIIKISQNIYFIFILKNIITFSILFMSLFVSLKKVSKFMLF